jgi:hypothetical protein
MMDEARLLEKLRRIEALHAGATTDGERLAAAGARERIRARLEAQTREEPPVENKFTFPDAWQRRLFLALLRRYDLSPYRYRGQRHTTVMTRAPRRFVVETLWPEFQELAEELRLHLDEVTGRIISEAVHGDSSEAAEVNEPRALR